MGLTRAIVKQTVRGNDKVVYADFTFDSSYLTGGEALAAADFGLRAINFLTIEQDADGYLVKWDRENDKLMAFSQGVRTGSTTVADATTGALIEDDKAAETAFRAMGTAADTDYSMGALTEVISTTDLSGVTVRIKAEGT